MALGSVQGDTKMRQQGEIWPYCLNLAKKVSHVYLYICLFGTRSAFFGTPRDMCENALIWDCGLCYGDQPTSPTESIWCSQPIVHASKAIHFSSVRQSAVCAVWGLSVSDYYILGRSGTPPGCPLLAYRNDRERSGGSNAELTFDIASPMVLFIWSSPLSYISCITYSDNYYEERPFLSHHLHHVHDASHRIFLGFLFLFLSFLGHQVCPIFVTVMHA